MGEAPHFEKEPAYAYLAWYTPARDYMSLGDAKATALLGANGLLISILLFFAEPVGAIASGPDVVQAVLVLAITAPLVMLLLVGAWNSFSAIVLRLPPMPQGLSFFGHIAEVSLEDYRAQAKRLGYGPALRDRLHYYYSASTLAEQKFRLVNRAVSCLQAAFFLWIVLMLRITLGG